MHQDIKTDNTAYKAAWKLFKDCAPIEEFSAALKSVPTKYLSGMIDETVIFFAETGADRDGSEDAWEEHLIWLEDAALGEDECDACRYTFNRDTLVEHFNHQWLCPACAELDNRGELYE